MKPTLADPKSPALSPGDAPIPGFRLVRRRGRGGYGEVWEAKAAGEISVALKFVRLSGRASSAELRALEIVRSIRHPNILANFGAWQVDDLLIFGMELADRSLWDRHVEAREQGLRGIPRPELLGYMAEVAAGLGHLNEYRHSFEGRDKVGVQHRDLKPSNILLFGGGAKVADLGMARAMEDAVAGHTGIWTLGYAAPEFFRGETNRQSDQYGLAATYCQLRSGRLPFEGSVASVTAGHLFGEPDLEAIPEPERPIIGRALSKLAGDRWPDCRAFIDALRAIPAGAVPDILIEPAEPDDIPREFRSSTGANSVPATGFEPPSGSRDDAYGISCDSTEWRGVGPDRPGRSMIVPIGAHSSGPLTPRTPLAPPTDSTPPTPTIGAGAGPGRTPAPEPAAPPDRPGRPERAWRWAAIAAATTIVVATAALRTPEDPGRRPILDAPRPPRPAPVPTELGRLDPAPVPEIDPLESHAIATVGPIAAPEPGHPGPTAPADPVVSRVSLKPVEPGPPTIPTPEIDLRPLGSSTRPTIGPAPADRAQPGIVLERPLEREAGDPRAVSLPFPEPGGSPSASRPPSDASAIPASVASPAPAGPIDGPPPGGQVDGPGSDDRAPAPPIASPPARTLASIDPPPATSPFRPADPGAARSALARGRAFLIRQSYAGAVVELDEAIRIDPNLPASYFLRGVARQRLGATTAALADFDEAIRRAPGDAQAHIARAQAHHDLGDYARAIADYDTALRIDPENARFAVSREDARARLAIRAGRAAPVEAGRALLPATARPGDGPARVEASKAAQPPPPPAQPPPDQKAGQARPNPASPPWRVQPIRRILPWLFPRSR